MLRDKSDRPPGTPAEARVRPPLVERVVGWSIRRRGRVIGGWLVLVVLTVLASGAVSGGGASSHDPGQSGRAQQVLRAEPSYEPKLENVLVQARQPGGALFADDPAQRAAVQDLLTTLGRTPGVVTGLRSPLDSPQQVSKDRHSGLVTFFVAGPNNQMTRHYRAVTTAVAQVTARHPDVRVVQAGDRSLDNAVDDAVQSDFHRSETISLPITAVILLLVFGSLVAAAVPLLLAAATVAATFGLVSVVGTWVPVNSAASSMILLVGVAVSVDYALFYLRREREERAAGQDVAQALRTSARTSGRVVVVSGVTVTLCVAGLLFTGLDNFRGLAVGTAMIVALAVLASVTLLPALLAVLGWRVEAIRLPFLGRRRAQARPSRLWLGIAGAVVRRPLLWGGAAAVLLLVMAAPALGIHLQDAGPTNSLPRSVAAVDGAVRMQQAFPGAPSPAKVVVSGPVDDAALATTVDRLHDEIAASNGLLNEPLSVTRIDQSVMIRVPLAGAGTDPQSNHALESLRDRVLPGTVGKLPGVRYAVAGRTAFAYDFTHQVRRTMPMVFAFVLVLAFFLLAAAFRTWTVPLLSIALNLLSIGAAYGVLTWVFQDGHLGSVLGFTSYGGVVDWLPLFMFVLLFGLSMDYHIFILSRIRERWSAGAPARTATVDGVGASAGVVTSAATIMTAVFSVFIVLSAIEYKMLGLGMAIAVLIDATIVRGILLPAGMSLLGERAWTSSRRRPACRIPDPSAGPDASADPARREAAVTTTGRFGR
ncbi:putative drug exporter of the RND superfamily [Frankia sp. AgKG'84/4]